ncbi:probable calcium-binding protein CML36 [Pistacia vera]|uniref:probable calcium-binding protein CML36 n=1 Tax=Pistacia vera TaxID=55513 RepID=UPI001262E882|nr:probable calcium-binding protein CML36 [Pistacia vera]
MKHIIHKLSPTRFFLKKKKDKVTRSHPSSFSSSSSSDSSSSNHHRKPSSAPDVTSTPTSVLPQRSGDWSDISADIHYELVQVFKLLDSDNDGLVSRTELESLLIRLGAEPPTQEEVSLMLSEVASDGDGCISLDALTSRVVDSAYKPAREPELRETFDFFDTDHDGKITAEELLRVFTELGDQQCTLEDCRRMIALVGKNENGFVCFEDFSKMMELER